MSFSPSSGLTSVLLSSTGGRDVVLLIADYDTAKQFWHPSVAGRGTFVNFVDLAASTPLLVHGPYLVRHASSEEDCLDVWGDVDKKTTMTVYGASKVNAIKWNNKQLDGLREVGDGIYQITIDVTEPNLLIPDLMKATWKYKDSLPEIKFDFDGFAMIPANHTNTTSAFPPYYGEPCVLYSDDYGSHVSASCLIDIKLMDTGW